MAGGVIEIRAGGRIRADGAPGGKCQDTGAVGGGGAGAGRAVWLSAPTVINDGQVRASGGVNCALNGGTENHGRGGMGRIRVDTGSGGAVGGDFLPPVGWTSVVGP